ncbi:ribosomal protein L7/L12 [Rhizohabitans arisaemae]|uniref:ribosomal protein L7/L12 n=1 Tax=Rhizohabitans arisaemae TaxID=2720610 RepID=UPI0024B22F7A|nr:ribosomal protein L7/L12 [Rhizohabitans arisaemae]
MPNLGPVELILWLGVVGLPVAIVLGVVMIFRRRVVKQSIPVAGSPPAVPGADFETRAMALIQNGKKIQAIKLIREETGLGLKQAKHVADQMEAGRYVPPRRAVAVPDLATRVRELTAAGRTEQAIHLIRGETGMGQDEAEHFIQAL